MSKDSFPLLDVPEIVMCLQSCDFNLAAEENIRKPTSTYIIKLYQQIVKGFTGVSSDSYLDATRNLPDDEDAIFFGTLQILTLNKTCYKFFQDVGIDDFNMMDLNKPDFERTRRMLSAVVNYARFREERMFDCKKFINEMENLLNELRSKFDDFNLLRQQTKDIEDQIGHINDSLEGNSEEDLNELENKNKNLETELKKLTKLQETLSIDYNNYKTEKQKLLKELETLGFQFVELESKREKLNKYSTTDINKLNSEISEYSKILKEKQETLSNLETKQTNLETSVQTFERVINELYDLLRIISTELQEPHRVEVSLIEVKQQLLTNRENLKEILSSNILYKLAILKDQLNQQQVKFHELQKTTEIQSQKNQNKLNELERKYNEEILIELKEADTRIQRDIINGELKSVESEISELKKEFNNEIDAIEQEYSLLAGRINKYMQEMLKNMD
ncbi:hypothetical protein KAFR_0C01110 [Kazachstania africana CBS 2517]|uniref:Kinetochore protein Nuf2 N-terminal domain-containing protein n=1 Tax=Kazachstania africana (strain ATCC 22294 / BCRC 22015 / CBS 2517 / CECT 1963 / NBRC 1671 / NRRL Y-8276) TaxID=1071382 RepID=H2ARV6_KAZAF|nr:hypothetical protein KAFR_0C01110 [Kazachstania africana CBS 2517]CCF57106.1 hypothetical protein KAFR_0C01110 [Kazachstania africana CBS 2517]